MDIDKAQLGSRIAAEGQSIGQYTSGAFKPFATVGDPKRKYVSTTADTDLWVSTEGIFWNESTQDHTKETDWRIPSVHPGSNEVTALASKKDLAASDQSNEYQFVGKPMAVGDRVFWEYYEYQPADGSAINKVFSVDVKAPGVVREGIGDSVDAPSGSSQTWASDFISTALLEKSGEDELIEVLSSYALTGERKEILHMRQSGGTRSEVLLVGTDKPSFSLTHAESVLLVDTSKCEALLFSGPKDSQVSSTSQCGSMLSWVFLEEGAKHATERYVFDSESKELMVLPGAPRVTAGWCSRGLPWVGCVGPGVRLNRRLGCHNPLEALTKKMLKKSLGRPGFRSPPHTRSLTKETSVCGSWNPDGPGRLKRPRPRFRRDGSTGPWGS